MGLAMLYRAGLHWLVFAFRPLGCLGLAKAAARRAPGLAAARRVVEGFRGPRSVRRPHARP